MQKGNMLVGKKINLSKEHKKELEYALLKINIKREKILSYILCTIVLVLLSVDIFFPHNKELAKYVSSESFYFHVILLGLSIAFLILAHLNSGISDKNMKIMRLAHIIINVSVMTLCAVIAVNNKMGDQRPFAYVTAMFAIASLVLLEPVERFFIYIVSYLYYILGMYLVADNAVFLFQSLFFTIPLMILALLVSKINYYAYVDNFISQKVIISKNQELNSMYKQIEGTLAKRTEELNEVKEFEKLRTVFLANISHELRTPLNVIFSAEQMLELFTRDNDNKDNERQIEQYLKIVRQNCYRLIRLIANLIDLTKIDAGYFQVNLENYDLVKIVEDITLSVAKYIEDKNINLIFDTEVEEKLMACDPDKIERIMLNLLSNATKFTPIGGNIYVNIYDKGDKITINVKDTGIGIPEEMKEKIFERFIQVDKTTSRNREGSGIGLSIVKSLVEMHNGNISLKSKIGEGSEFIIEIPVKEISCDMDSVNSNLTRESHHVEKINVEFSDIYY